MKKITPRMISRVECDEPIVVTFTSVHGSGAGRGGASVEHEGRVESVNDPSSLQYAYDGDVYTFELSTGYIRDEAGDDVLGRDARARIE